MSQKTVFLTGATGLVGSYLLKILLQEGYKVYVLARGKDNKNARDRVTDVLEFWDKDVLSKTQNPPSPPFVKGGQGGFSEQKGKLKKVNHISTAYICGDYKGAFKEEDLDVGQKFNSTYEQSKFEAEKLVEKYRKGGLWIDVFRPPIIIGESNTGKILQFRNIY